MKIQLQSNNQTLGYRAGDDPKVGNILTIDGKNYVVKEITPKPYHGLSLFFLGLRSFLATIFSLFIGLASDRLRDDWNTCVKKSRSIVKCVPQEEDNRTSNIFKNSVPPQPIKPLKPEPPTGGGPSWGGPKPKPEPIISPRPPGPTGGPSGSPKPKPEPIIPPSSHVPTGGPSAGPKPKPKPEPIISSPPPPPVQSPPPQPSAPKQPVSSLAKPLPKDQVLPKDIDPKIYNELKEKIDNDEEWIHLQFKTFADRDKYAKVIAYIFWVEKNIEVNSGVRGDTNYVIRTPKSKAFRDEEFLFGGEWATPDNVTLDFLKNFRPPGT